MRRQKAPQRQVFVGASDRLTLARQASCDETVFQCDEIATKHSSDIEPTQSGEATMQIGTFEQGYMAGW
jgi:hypothetical protein